MVIFLLWVEKCENEDSLLVMFHDKKAYIGERNSVI